MENTANSTDVTDIPNAITLEKNKPQKISGVSNQDENEVRIMYCKKCGAQIDDDSIYCKKCGINITEAENEKTFEERIVENQIQIRTQLIGIKTGIEILIGTIIALSLTGFLVFGSKLL